MLNDILTLDQQWLPNQSDFSPFSWPWYRLWPSPNYEWFPWSICNWCGMPTGNAYPSRHLVPSPILGLANAPIVETKVLELAMSLLDFSPRIPLGTFSVLLWWTKKINFVIINNFVIKASLVLVFSINIIAYITLMGKIPQKYHKSQKVTNFTLNYNWMRYDVLHDRATLEYQYPSDCFTWRWPDRELHVYFNEV